ncbi:unnamed protein product [Protopolystoma xenopodis]|uniref:Uncharacterized protein n=1 Tax=Protopolystoma xenopodis TaxID=117903 RepID=A0A448WAD5_9PLAT|nr:unnamed protein product [Protopolystoma xenopodis]
MVIEVYRLPILGSGKRNLKNELGCFLEMGIQKKLKGKQRKYIKTVDMSILPRIGLEAAADTIEMENSRNPEAKGNPILKLAYTT